jgi:TrmH family RNA methyltransferase
MPFDQILSLTNSKIKQIIRLREHKERKKCGLTIVEGKKEIFHALESGLNFKEIFFAADQEKILKQEGLLSRITLHKIPAVSLAEDVYAKAAYGERADGILGVAEIPIYDEKSLKVSQNPFYVVIEGVEKPGNLGAILRTCDGAGVDAVFVGDPKTDLFNPNVIRASIGTVFSVKPIVSSNEEIYKRLVSQKVKIFAAVPSEGKVYTQVDFRGPSAVILGSEHDGLSLFWKEKSHQSLSIPMKGKADSLNVSIASALLIYEALRQRDNG